MAYDLEMSESESDHSEDNDDSGSNNTVNTEEQIPGELEEMDKEKQKTDVLHQMVFFTAPPNKTAL